MKTPRPLLALLAALVLAVSFPAGADDPWQQEVTEQDVVVSTRAEAGRSLPVFRGVGTVDASPFEILAVLDDLGHYTDWMANCASAHVVRQITEFERIGYNRIAAPWPVADRDSTLRSWIEASASKGDIWARFEAVNAPEAGPVPGVVRMTRLAGFYHLEVLDAGHTKVTYQVDADPGGLLPDWLIKLTSRKLPVQTLVNLRKRIAQTRGQYEAFLKKYDPSHGGKIPAQFAN